METTDTAKQKQPRPAYNYRNFLRWEYKEGAAIPGNVWFYRPGSTWPTVSCGYCHVVGEVDLGQVTPFGEIDLKVCGNGEVIPVRLMGWDNGRGVIAREGVKA